MCFCVNCCAHAPRQRVRQYRRKLCGVCVSREGLAGWCSSYPAAPVVSVGGAPNGKCCRPWCSVSAHSHTTLGLMTTSRLEGTDRSLGAATLCTLPVFLYLGVSLWRRHNPRDGGGIVPEYRHNPRDGARVPLMCHRLDLIVDLSG